MTHGRRSHAFEAVDSQAEPAAWIEVLDTLSREPLYRPYKTRAAELLDASPGGRYLEVGVGAGTDALAFADRYGARVVGLDRSVAMVEEARRRGVEAVVADVHALPFESASFDGAWADRTFQHLEDPAAALAELVRVVGPGGRVAVADPDYSTQVVNVREQELAGRVLRFRAEHAIRNGTLAHQLPRVFLEAGLVDVHVESFPVVVRDPTSLDNALGLRDWASFAHERGLIERREIRVWEGALDEAAAQGWFLYSFTVFITVGTKAPSGRRGERRTGH